MSLSIYFLRHGETTYSQTGSYCGDIDPELTPAGQRMAQAFADAYRTLNWSAVYSSPMRRAIATAKPLCQAIGAEIHGRDGLKEIKYGAWEGKTLEYVKEHFSADYLKWLAEPGWNAPTGGETAYEIANRAMPVIFEIQQQQPEGNVLVVSHKATIRILLCSLLGIELGRYRDRIAVPAASLCVVKFDDHGPLLETLGDRSHMTDDLRQLPGT